MGLAIKFEVPWDEANQKRDFSVRLLTEDGVSPTLQTASGPQQQTVEATGQFEVGRPAGLRPGTPLDRPLAMNFRAVPLPPGRYVWQIAIEDHVIEQLPFSVVESKAR